MQDEDTAFAFKFRSSRAWKRLRKVKLSMNPICEDPFGDHQKFKTTANGDHVHHIKSIREEPEMRAELTNLMTVCHRCHARFNAEERRDTDEE